MPRSDEPEQTSGEAVLEERILTLEAAQADCDAYPKVQGPLKERLGRYTVIQAADVIPTMQTLKCGVRVPLAAGQTIEVLEILTNDEERLIRARIAEPPGWISLAHMDTGTRWAVHADDVKEPAVAEFATPERSPGQEDVGPWGRPYVVSAEEQRVIDAYAALWWPS